MIRVKICGVRDARAIDASVAAGATYLGLNFFEPSPRFVPFADAAGLAGNVPPGIAKVALSVDATDAELDQITGTVPVDMLQLHGSETPARIGELKARYGLPVIKAVPVAVADDLQFLPSYEQVADQILLDAKPPVGSEIPGGHGVPFDWRLIAGRRWSVPWMLSGGLTPDNVAEAISLTGATQVDVSSGVEASRGVKDTGLIASFLSAAQGAPVPVSTGK